MYNVSLLLYFFILFLYCLFITNCTRTFWYVQFTRGFSVPHNMARKVQTLSRVRHPKLIALYASAPNHVFGQTLGLPGSWVSRLTFCSYWLRRPKENYCDCSLVIPYEHLSRESRKLTVMMRRELVAIREVSNP